MKGTPLVFKYIEKYLGIKLYDVVYTAETISFQIDIAETYNINTFIKVAVTFIGMLKIL